MSTLMPKKADKSFPVMRQEGKSAVKETFVAGEAAQPPVSILSQDQRAAKLSSAAGYLYIEMVRVRRVRESDTLGIELTTGRVKEYFSSIQSFFFSGPLAKMFSLLRNNKKDSSLSSSSLFLSEKHRLSNEEVAEWEHNFEKLLLHEGENFLFACYRCFSR